MKKTLTVLMLLILVGFVWGGEAEKTDPVDKIRNAEQVLWASKDYVVVDGNMIRMSDGEVIFDGVGVVSTGGYALISDGRMFRLDNGVITDVGGVVSTGGYAWIETSDGIRIMDKTGNIHALPVVKDELDFSEVYGTCGLFYGTSGDQSYIYNPVEDEFLVLPESKISEVYQDHEGQVYILTEDCGIFRANGEQILEQGKYGIILNCNWDPITNEYLTVTAYDHNDDWSAVVLSPYTGEEICRFDGCSWAPYDMNHDIYRDNTALLNDDLNRCPYGWGTMIIGLDGTVLKKLPEDHVFCDRGETSFLYPIDSLGGGGRYNVITDRTYYYDDRYPDPVIYITCDETGETFKGIRDADGYITECQSLTTGKIYSEEEVYMSGDPIPERYEKYRPVNEREFWLEYVETAGDSYGVEITCPDGSVLGGRTWSEIPWRNGIEALEGYFIFPYGSVTAVQDKNGLIGVINKQGEMVLSAEYEQVNCIGSFSDDPKENGYCIAALKDDTWHIFDFQGNLLYSIPRTASASNATSAPEVASVPIQDPDSVGIPVLSEMFPGREVQLVRIGGNERITLFSGPGNDYMVIRKINPRERNTTTAYFRENGKVFVHYVHRGVDVYAYVSETSIMTESLTGIPEVEKLRSISMTTKKGVAPKTGPGEEFGIWPESEIPADSRIRCWFREGNYCYMEYEFPAGPARVWVDTSAIGL